MKTLVTVVAVTMLLPIAAFCVFGFMATFEPTDQPGGFLGFRICYGIVGVGCLIAVIALIAWALRSSLKKVA